MNKATLHLLPALLECPDAGAADLAECDTEEFTIDDLNDYLYVVDTCTEGTGGTLA